MPRIPTLQQQVGTAPLPGVRLSPDAPSAAFQPPAPTDLSGAADFFQREKAKADQLAVLDADNQLSELSLELQSAALQRRGKDALGASQDIAEQWQQRSAVIEGTLRGVQRDAYRQRESARWASLHETVERHAAGEARTFDDQTTTAAITNRLNDALSNYQDPTKVAGAIAETRAIRADYARRNGLSPEVAQQQLGEDVSRVHVHVIGRMLAAGDDQTAATYYTAHAGDVVGADKESIDRALESASTLGAAQRKADAILATPDLTRADAFAAAKDETDPKVRKLVEATLDEAFARQDRNTRDARDQLYQRAAVRAEQTGARPMDVWWTLTAQERESIDARLKQMATGTPARTDDVMYYRLVRAAATNPQAFAKENLAVYFPYLASSDRQELARMQAAVIKGDDKTDAHLVGIRTSQRIVDDALLGLGVDPSPDPRKNKGDVEIGLKFRRAVDDEVRALEQRTQKKATPDEVQGITDRLLTSGAVVGSSGLFSGPAQRRVFEQQPGESLVLTAADIPRGERVKLEAAIRSAGGVVSDATVLRLYTRTIGRMLKAAP